MYIIKSLHLHDIVLVCRRNGFFVKDIIIV